MKPAATFLLLTALALGIGGTTEFAAVRVVSGAAGVSFGWVAVAYALRRPGLLGKRPDGRRRGWAWPLLGPYWLLNDLGLLLFRLGERDPPVAEVAPNLWFGRRLTGREALGPGMPPWRAVIDLAAELPEARPLRSLVRYTSIPMLDAAAPTPRDLNAAISFILMRLSGGPVYVHCALGHGRSAMIVVAFLVASRRVATVDEGIALVTARRPGVRLSAGQLAMLADVARLSAETPA